MFKGLANLNPGVSNSDQGQSHTSQTWALLLASSMLTLPKFNGLGLAGEAWGKKVDVLKTKNFGVALYLKRSRLGGWLGKLGGGKPLNPKP